MIGFNINGTFVPARKVSRLMFSMVHTVCKVLANGDDAITDGYTIEFYNGDNKIEVINCNICINIFNRKSSAAKLDIDYSEVIAEKFNKLYGDYAKAIVVPNTGIVFFQGE